MGDIRNVLWQKSVSKQLERLPVHIARTFLRLGDSRKTSRFEIGKNQLWLS